MYFDPMYFVILAPALVLGAWAQWKVKAAFTRAKQQPCRSGFTGAQAAARVLAVNGLEGVGIEPARGFLSDHYDPRSKTLRLSPDVYNGRSLAAVGIAAHEAGHALQDARGYAPLALRNGIVPLASLGPNLSFVLLIGGFFLQWTGLIWAGIFLYSAFVLFQLINLPVEYNASSRAREVLLSSGIISANEQGAVRKVLSAAALTYVAATVTAILTLVYFLLRSGVLGGRSD
jgi:Zn-dependent membrane protease YugP